MEIIFYIIIFIFGLIVGSFLNCVIYRLEKKQNFLKGRSFCPNCKHNLVWQDLIPVFSFLILRGKCRYCRKKISCQYPLVEIAAGLVFLLIAFTFQNPLYVFFLFVIFSFLIIIFVYDLKHYIIPDKVVYPLILIALIYHLLFFNFSFLLYALISAFLASGFFLSIVLISRGRGMGLGDVKLAFFMGFFLGFPNILAALFSAFLIGAIIGIGIILTGKKTLKSEVPFGPFLVFATLLAFFWGKDLINWYLNLII